ncbi:hypothetical protein D3C75_547870 [compost metagenome]
MPSATAQPSTSELSSQWAITGISSPAAIFIASFIIWALCTPTPSSVKPIAPASFKAAKSVSSRPSSFFVMAAYGSTFTSPASAALSFTNCTISGLSVTGRVFGMQAIVVKPPFAAERAPVSMVSLCSKPGSRRCTCISISPGISSLPSASIISPASSRASLSFLIAEMTPSCTTICLRSSTPSPFSTLAFLMITVMILLLPAGVRPRDL